MLCGENNQMGREQKPLNSFKFGHPTLLDRSNILIFGTRGSGKTADVGIPNAIESLSKGESLIVTCCDSDYESELTAILNERKIMSRRLDISNLPVQFPDWLSNFGKKQEVLFISLPHTSVSKKTADQFSEVLARLLSIADRPITVIIDDMEKIPYLYIIQELLSSIELSNYRIMMLADPDGFDEFYSADIFGTIGVINGRNFINTSGVEFMRKWLRTENVDMFVDCGNNEMMLYMRGKEPLNIEITKLSLTLRRYGLRLGC